MKKLSSLAPYIIRINKKRNEYFRVLYEKKFELIPQGIGNDMDNQEVRVEGFVEMDGIGEEGPKYTVTKEPIKVRLEYSRLEITKESNSSTRAIHLREARIYDIIYLALLQKELRIFDLLEEKMKKHEESLTKMLSSIKQIASLVEIALGGRQDGSEK